MPTNQETQGSPSAHETMLADTDMSDVIKGDL